MLIMVRGLCLMSNYNKLQDTLLDWFQSKGRDLPWRLKRDPYAVLVSEIMLQQTQVARVIPHYLSFLKQFPTVSDLAQASVSDVLRTWVGLGYNRRAINLLDIAKIVVAKHKGIIPENPEVLRQLKGIGPYTAHAIPCFAYGKDYALLDTNNKRVIGRIFFGVKHPKDQQLIQIANKLVPKGKAWYWNQALMDLGSGVCTARKPNCQECPVKSYCRASKSLLASYKKMIPPASMRTCNSGPAGKAEIKQTQFRKIPFFETNRFFRGRIIYALHLLQPGERMSLTELSKVITPDETEGDSRWLYDLLEVLHEEGLVRIFEQHGQDFISLPEA
ncbi:A/G-specific adenine glycosylase [SAR202 cluster bacterium AD-802-E10_MRT_200m]|nr:A/G-specific adenine glycosylase [SAR202 cluster bacterium AD-802-E10_MRT_200m]